MTVIDGSHSVHIELDASQMLLYTHTHTQTHSIQPIEKTKLDVCLCALWPISRVDLLLLYWDVMTLISALFRKLLWLPNRQLNWTILHIVNGADVHIHIHTQAKNPILFSLKFLTPHLLSQMTWTKIAHETWILGHVSEVWLRCSSPSFSYPLHHIQILTVVMVVVIVEILFLSYVSSIRPNVNFHLTLPPNHSSFKI